MSCPELPEEDSVSSLKRKEESREGKSKGIKENIPGLVRLCRKFFKFMEKDPDGQCLIEMN